MITSLLILRFCFPRDWVSKLIFSKCHRHGSQNTLLHVALHLHHRKRCVWLIIKVRVPSNLCVIYFDIGGRVGSMAERLMFFSFYFFPSFFLSLPSFLLHPAQILKDLTKETNFSHVYLSSSFQPLRKVNDHRWHSSGKWRASPQLSFPRDDPEHCLTDCSCCTHQTVDPKTSRYLNPFTGGRQLTTNLVTCFPLLQIWWCWSHFQLTLHRKPTPRLAALDATKVETLHSSAGP